MAKNERTTCSQSFRLVSLDNFCKRLYVLEKDGICRGEAAPANDPVKNKMKTPPIPAAMNIEVFGIREGPGMLVVIN